MEIKASPKQVPTTLHSQPNRQQGGPEARHEREAPEVVRAQFCLQGSVGGGEGVGRGVGVQLAKVPAQPLGREGGREGLVMGPSPGCRWPAPE